MRFRSNIIFFVAGLVILATACTKYITVYSVGEVDNKIVLGAGVSTRAGEPGTKTGAEDHHAHHHTFTEGTKLRLRFDGDWTGHDPSTVSISTVATIGAVAEDTDDKHNVLARPYNPDVFWDNFGTADPANTAGRDKGLSIFGVAVNGKTDAAPVVSSWTALPWQVLENQKTSGWSQQDLLTSNNVKDGGLDGAYKFDQRASGKLLEFTHAMTKVTVVLTAGKGFNEEKFVEKPSVTLLQFYASGTVNVETKTSTPTATAETTKDIQMYLSSGGAASHTATFDALVFPGNLFTNESDILSFEADGNGYTVKAKMLLDAIQAAITNTATTGYPTDKGKYLLQAWDYQINIKVNKTDIELTATIRDWNQVETQEEEPKIRIEDSFGQTGDAFVYDFDFFRSTALASGYSKDAYVEHSESAGVHSYTLHEQLYWPDHQTHYFFRGVYPRVQTDSQDGWIPVAKISSSTSSAATITVQNSAYVAEKYPSDLAIAIPRTDTETCTAHSKKVDEFGICATEGTIRMNFEYAMSKVQVSLKSSGTAGKDKVDLSNVSVDVIGGYSTARIQLSNGLHDAYAVGDKAIYTLHATTAEDGYEVTTLDAMVPQEIGNDVILRVTVTNTNSTTDVYEIQLNTIKDSSSAVVGEWEHGKYYKYRLDIKKSAVNVQATITDWVNVDANGEMWL